MFGYGSNDLAPLHQTCAHPLLNSAKRTPNAGSASLPRLFCPPDRWGFAAADPRQARGAAPAREIAPRAAPRCLSRCCDCRPARPLAFHAPVRSSPRPTVQMARLATSRSSVRVAGCNSRCLSQPSDRSIASSAVRGASPPSLAKESALQDARGTCSAPTHRACARSSGPRGS